MRIGIYNRWLATLGGGERFTLDVARVLARQGHSVELISHAPIDIATISQRLALDLAALHLRRVPDSPANARLSAVSAEYDLLINMSQGDLFPSAARRSLLIVHFPAELTAYVNAGVPTRQGGSMRIVWLEGVYPPESDGQQTWAWTGSGACIEVVCHGFTPARSLLIAAADLLPPSVPPPEVCVRVNGVEVGSRRDRWTTWRMRLPQPLAPRRPHTIQLEVTPWTLRALGLAPDDRERGIALRGIGLQSWPFARSAIASVAPTIPTDRSVAEVQRVLDTYDLIAANSRFTQAWIARRWDRPSVVLYPAVDAATIPRHAKAPIILSVGRFFAGAHNKKHLPMIAAFRALCDAGLSGWEYHLVGGCDRDQPEQRAYLAEVEAAAQGYPVMIHVNAPLAELHDLYGRAQIFWHATGYGEDEERDPDSFEHFGITTIEAMAAGGVPIVIAKAGQIETVLPEQSGLLWHTLDELEAQTLRVINDASLRQRLAAGAIRRSHDFSFDVLNHRLAELLSQLDR